jgi:aspartate aminotransferase-like enzyme
MIKIRKYGKYGRKANWIVKRYGKYGRKVSWIVKRYGRKVS